jgi:hypothetical protein
MKHDLELMKSKLPDQESRDKLEAEYKRMGKLSNASGITIEEVPDDLVDQNEDECPELEKVELERLEQTKQQKQKEWLDKVVAEQEAANK